MKKILALIALTVLSATPLMVGAEQINVGTRNDGAPYVEIDADGIPSGFDMDILHAIAQDQGLDLNIRVQDFANLLPGLEDDVFDLVIGGITITDERKQHYDFSEAYIEDFVGVLATDPSLDLSSMEKVAQLDMALERNTLYHQAFAGLSENPLLVDSVFLGIKNVAQGKAEVFVSDEFIIAHAIKGYDGIDFIIQRLPTAGHIPDNKIGIAVKKGNQPLLDKINQGLANIKANGTYAQIQDKWQMQ